MKTHQLLQVRQDFPFFSATTASGPITYMDSAATSQKPYPVIEAVHHFYTRNNAPVRRSAYPIAAAATQAYEAVRDQVQQFIGAADRREIIFTRSATEAINLVAMAFAEPLLQAGDEIVISAMEHHANLIPWQQLCIRRGAHLRVIPVNESGELCLDRLPDLLHARTRLLAITHISNVLGTINPLPEIIALARSRGIPTLVDGAQSAAHHPIDVGALDCDFFVFSGHKMFAPSGLGVLYGKRALLETMQPVFFGGDMIRTVRFERTLFADLPARLEAGTPNIEGVIGLGAAIAYIQSIEKRHMLTHLQQLLAYATAQLTAIEGLRIIGNASQKAAIISFLVNDIHPHDMATYLGEAGIMLRAGHHCAQPLMAALGIPGALRASFSIYNNLEDIDRLSEGIRAAQRFFR